MKKSGVGGLFARITRRIRYRHHWTRTTPRSGVAHLVASSLSLVSCDTEVEDEGGGTHAFRNTIVVDLGRE